MITQLPRSHTMRKLLFNISLKKRLYTSAIIFSVIDAGAAVYILASTAANPTGITPRPDQWAMPIHRKGLPNLHQVTPVLYRGAQPTAAGMRQLKAMGVKTVINLHSFNSDRDELGDTRLGYEHICMKAWYSEREDVIRFLHITTDKNRTPAFVHCQHGADRTGLMYAIYRVAVCGWTKEETIQEMTLGGFGRHTVWANLVKFIQDPDVEGIKRQVVIIDE